MRRQLVFRAAAALALILLGAIAIVRWDIALRRDEFRAVSQGVHRHLSQRAAQQEAILRMLGLMNPQEAGRAYGALRDRFPQIEEIVRRGADEPWPDKALNEASGRSREQRRVVTAPVRADRTGYWLILAEDEVTHALRVDLTRLRAADEWPLDRRSPLRITVSDAAMNIVLQPGEPEQLRPFGLTAGFVFSRPLDTDSQRFELYVQQATGPTQWPWRWLMAWTLLVIAVLTVLAIARQLRDDRRRAEEQLRIGQVARLNTLGELAGGMAHELNQPLTAVLASTQAAQRLLAENPPELDTARQAIDAAAIQARRAANVVTRLRGLVESPAEPYQLQPVALERTALGVLDVYGPEIRRLDVRVSSRLQPCRVMADATALEQIVHNLVGNALAALAEVSIDERGLELRIEADINTQRGWLIVSDHGPGFAPGARARVFEPFFTTRSGGLGLGLSLCETLAQGMNGILSAHDAAGRGAEFRLALPLADAGPKAP